jgi:hypothetical protein
MIRRASSRPASSVTSGAVLQALKQTLPEVRSGRWREAVLSAFLFRSRQGGAPRDFVALVNGFRYEPDAYATYKSDGGLSFFEIEIYNPMTDEKLEAYGKLVTDLHWHGIALEVYTINRYGHMNQVDLLPHYVRWLEAQSRC